MRKFLFDVVLVFIVLVAVYGIILYVTPNWGRRLFSSLTRQPSTEVRYITHTEVVTEWKYIEVPPQTVPADSVYVDPVTEDEIQEYAWMPEHQYLRGWVHVEVNTTKAEATFTEKDFHVLHTETTHYVTREIRITPPPKIIRPKLGIGYGWGEEQNSFELGAGVMLFETVDIIGEVSTDKTVRVMAYYTFW